MGLLYIQNTLLYKLPGLVYPAVSWVSQTQRKYESRYKFRILYNQFNKIIFNVGFTSIGWLNLNKTAVSSGL